MATSSLFHETSMVSKGLGPEDWGLGARGQVRANLSFRRPSPVVTVRPCHTQGLELQSSLAERCLATVQVDPALESVGVAPRYVAGAPDARLRSVVSPGYRSYGAEGPNVR